MLRCFLHHSDEVPIQHSDVKGTTPTLGTQVLRLQRTTMSTPRISPHSLPDLKSTTDDALTNYLLSLNFTPIHTKLDTRLALGYTSVIIAAITFAADYKLGWEATKTWTAVAVVAYGALNAALTYWMWAVEKGVVFEGQREGVKVRSLSPMILKRHQ